MKNKKLNRREFLQKAAIGAAGLSTAAFVGPKFGTKQVAPYIKNSKIANKVIVLGIDGMDPKLLNQFILEGHMPNFKKAAEKGYLGPLQTTMPPQSPIAWSSFITGSNPGKHGIFDFIHRDPKTFTPYLSTTRSFGAAKTVDVGSWSFPIKSGHVDLMRRGTPFWTLLEESDIFASLYKLPANFPVQPTTSQTISGMGTPDLLGTYGTFSYFTDTDFGQEKKFSGGKVTKVNIIDHTIKTKMKGPKNPFRNDKVKPELEFTINRDPWEKTIKINIQDQEIILGQGDWSEWVPIKFELMPLFASVGGIVRFYAQEIFPHFKLYASPMNIDPLDPTLPICSPDEYSKDLTNAVGRFYTQGFPEDTKALSTGVFSDEEFLVQSKYVLNERLKSFDYELNNFKEGLLFFYFSSVDQNSHMMMHHMDPTHHLYDPKASPEVKNAMRYFYSEMDKVLEQTLSKVDNHTTLMVMSDHGFAPFKREFNLSTWLVENGYTAASNPSKLHDSEFYTYVDWRKTQAYALGINGIYLNLKGREKKGALSPHKADSIKKELIAKLETVVDPETGEKIISHAYDPHSIYSGSFIDLAPDIIVGYRSGYRISDESVLGKFPKKIFKNRTDKWAADHCMDSHFVPGILLTNKEVRKGQHHLWDLAPAILKSFALNVPSEMDGTSVYKAHV